MSDLGSIIDFSEDISEAEAPPALPVGDYPAKIVQAESVISVSSGKRNVKTTWRVMPEDFPADYEGAGEFGEGKDIVQYVGAADEGNARFRMRKFCEAIGAPMSTRLDVNDWIGKSAILTIEHEEFEGVNKERIRKVEAK